MVIVHFHGDKIVHTVYFNGTYEEAYLRAMKTCADGHFEIVSEATFRWKYKNINT